MNDGGGGGGEEEEVSALPIPPRPHFLSIDVMFCPVRNFLFDKAMC